MNKRDIIIIAALTVILATAAVMVFIVFAKPDIENIYLSSGSGPVIEKSRQENGYRIKKDAPGIYLVIEVNHVTADDEIKVQWEKYENDYSEIIQKNIVYPENKGSGILIISLVKKNNIYTPGSYSAAVYLNSDLKAREEFNILE